MGHRLQRMLAMQLPEGEMMPAQGRERQLRPPPPLVVKAVREEWERQAPDDGTLRRLWDARQFQKALRESRTEDLSNETLRRWMAHELSRKVRTLDPRGY